MRIIWIVAIAFLVVAYNEARYLGDAKNYNVYQKHTSGRQLILTKHDNRRDISSDIERELDYSGHNSKDFIASITHSSHQPLDKSVDPNNLKQYLNLEYLKNNDQSAPQKNFQSEIEKAYHASANEKLQMNSEDDKIEAKSRFPEHHTDDELNFQYFRNHFSANHPREINKLVRERQINHETFDRNSYTDEGPTPRRKEFYDERRHISHLRNEAHRDEEEYLPILHKHFHRNYGDDEQYENYVKGFRRHHYPKHYFSDHELYRRPSVNRKHHLSRYLEDRGSDYLQHFRHSEHSLPKAFEYDDDMKKKLAKSAPKSLKKFLRERDRDVYQHLFDKENSPNLLFDNISQEKTQEKPSPVNTIANTDRMMRDSTGLHKNADNFHAIGLTPYKHYTGLSDIADALPDETTSTSITLPQNVQPLQSVQNFKQPYNVAANNENPSPPMERILHDPQSSNDLVAMNPADDAINPGVQEVHAFHTPVVNNIPSEIDGLSLFHHNNIGLPRESSEFYTPPIHHMGSMPTAESDFVIPPNGQTPSLEHPSEMTQPPAGINIGLVDPIKVANAESRLPLSNMSPTQKSDVDHRNDIALADQPETDDDTTNAHPTEKRDINMEDVNPNMSEEETLHQTQEMSDSVNSKLGNQGPGMENSENHQTSSISVDSNSNENNQFIMQQVLQHREQSKRFDADIHNEISKLNEQEQNIAATAALQDDKIDLDAAQDLADDNRNKLINMRGSIPKKHHPMSRRHFIGGRFRNAHHYLVDQEPVHVHHRKFIHLYPLSRKFRRRFTPYLYEPPTFQRFNGYGHHRRFHPILSGRHNHAFDQIFQGGDEDTEFLTEPQNGYKTAIEDDQQPFDSAHTDDGYALMRNGKNLQYIHLRSVGSNLNLNHDFEAEVANGGVITKLPPHDAVTDNIVSDLSKGNDVTEVKGEDQVHVEHQDGDNKISGWLSRPYVYEAHPGRGWGDYGKMYHNNPQSYGEGFPPRSPSSRMQPMRRFPLEINAEDDEEQGLGATSFTTYNAPVHGLVVSEKDAKKIGLYDSNYLKKLGIWDDTSSIWNGGLPWGMYGIPWGNSGLNYAWAQGLIDKNAELRAINKTSNKEKPPEKACMIPTDVAFLFDASNTGAKKKEYFELFVEFAKQIVGYHQPSLEGYHFGAVYYGKGAKLKFDFEKSYEMNEVITELDALKNISMPSESSDLGEGLRITKEELFDKTAREWVYQVLVILTDSKGKGEVENWAKQFRDSTINIYVIGLVNSESMADIGQMEKIGTRPYKHHVFQVNPDHLLGTMKSVPHPQHLARIIPNQICRVNLVFVVDLSSNDSNTITQIKKFISETTADLGISSYGSHSAVIGYGVPLKSNITNETSLVSKENWDLVSKLDHTSFDNAVENLEEEASRSNNLADALELTFKLYSEESSEPLIATFWRYINVTVVIHGDSDISLSDQARNLKDNGVIVHVLDIGNNSTNDGQLAKVASSSEELYLHHVQDLSKLPIVAKRMRQYLSQLLFSQESETDKIVGGWEASYGNIMFDEEKNNVSRLPTNQSYLLNSDKKNIHSMAGKADTKSVPLTETLSQEPDWSKYIKMPTSETTPVTINKDDVELQDKVDENVTLSFKKKETKQKINHERT